ncbi:Competence protein A [Polystyrenella longa]|uniref:Competence protein A n=1 Tax=Polystyrenella longa TaxID=2528007 RepID=A0A518CMH8_9PLAN|nr:type IV pilus assembly protein PilM [Polystyrenella longa]QDU80435.1 Competence protein A [Polystyrenella longa]
MASKRGAWGIEIGQSALKAIRLEFNENTEQVVATAFDFVPHPKILSQPDAIPEELIAQSIEKFLSRNKLNNDVVGISVPGQAALTRFVQLPPVDASKIKDIVQFEARQQIPFDLDEVIWDYQTFGTADEETGYMLDAEVGLFAMKRDLIEQHFRPFSEVKIELDLIQTAPLALFNFLTFDQLGLKAEDQPATDGEYILLLDMGVDNTTLIVSNGQKIWTRNVGIGGNHFTRALTKEMKLTFAKAEHLKCNATRSPDPRAVFQALRPVFNNFVAEIQRSIGFFSSVNRDAQISRVVGVGNGFRMAGLQKFLQQNLQYDVERLDSFNELVGDKVISEPMFTENILTYAVPYGIALQMLDQCRIKTNLLPPEILTTRKIRQKKPWAMVTAATIMAGVTFSTLAYSMVSGSVSEERFGDAENAATSLKTTVDQAKSKYDELVAANKKIAAKANSFTSFVENRELWLEVYKAINESLPRDNPDLIDDMDLPDREQIRLTSITANKQSASQLTNWYNEILADDLAAATLSDRDRDNPPNANGYLFTLEGISYHYDENDLLKGQAEGYIKNTVLKNLQEWTIPLSGGFSFPIGKQGISYPVLANYELIARELDLSGNEFDPNEFLEGPNVKLEEQPKPDAGNQNVDEERDRRRSRGRGQSRTPIRSTTPGTEVEEKKSILETTFMIQFIWIPTPTEFRGETVAEGMELRSKLGSGTKPLKAEPETRTFGSGRD